jgi:hypothetical protein
MEKHLTFSIPMETVGNIAYLGLIAAFIGAFYLFCITMDAINKNSKK